MDTLLRGETSPNTLVTGTGFMSAMASGRKKAFGQAWPRRSRTLTLSIFLLMAALCAFISIVRVKKDREGFWSGEGSGQEKYLDPKRAQKIANFWKKYFLAGQAKIGEIGKPLMYGGME